MPSTGPDTTIAALFKRLGHPLRIALVRALRDGPLSVGALQQAVGASQSTVSLQLLRMRNEGIVTCHRSDADARIMVYTLADRRLADLIDLAEGLLPGA